MVSKRFIIIIIPVYKPNLDPTEELSFRQCLKILGKYKIAFCAPQSLNLKNYSKIIKEFDLKKEPIIKRFAPKFFQNIQTYNNLLLSPQFYNAFSHFEYMLIYQLDSYVFRDELTFWCNQGYDYIGAPWFEGFGHTNQESKFKGVGNGGFSLRRIESILTVLKSFAYIKSPKTIWSHFLSQPLQKKTIGAISMIKNLTIANNTFHLFNNFKGNEDRFFGYHANRIFDWFKVPEPEEALKFSFEVNPRKLFALNQETLPFGCHAFAKYEPDFWETYIN